MKKTGSDKPPQVPITKGPNKGKLHDRPDNGKLPVDIDEPECVADPNHRRKVLTGELYALANSKKAERKTMTKMDVKRLGRNFSYFIRTLNKLDEKDYESKAQAVLLHHFDDHTHCGDWCNRKLQIAEEKQSKDRYYRDKLKDAELFAVLQLSLIHI